MQIPLVFKATVLSGMTLSLAACGGSGGDLSLSNPSFFSARVKDGTMTGQFNSAGFSATQVRKLVSETCTSGAASGFGTQALENGLTAFSASCTNWRSDARAVEFQRAGGSNVVIEITGVVNGNLVYDRIDTIV